MRRDNPPERRAQGRPPVYDPAPEGPRGPDVVMVALALGMAAWVGVCALVSVKGCGDRPPPPELVEIPDLEDIEARMLQAAEITRRWEELAARHREATELACEQMAEVALAWEVR